MMKQRTKKNRKNTVRDSVRHMPQTSQVVSKKAEEEGSYRIYPPMFWATAIAGGVYGLGANWIYGRTDGQVSAIFRIGLIFLLMYVGLAAVVLAVSYFNGNMRRYFKRNSGLFIAVIAAAGAVLVFLLGMLFEFLYELDFKTELREPDAYIFLIDDSQSMDGNDKAYARYDAIEQVLEGKDQSFPYAIYQFNNNTRTARPFGPISDGLGTIAKKSEGGTQMQEALERLLADYDSGLWENSRYPRIILLTDGEASFRMLDQILEECVAKNISIGTVGLGSGTDAALLEKMAVKTGGKFVAIDKVSDLNTAMAAAGEERGSRTLLGVRNFVKSPKLYGGLRILFLMILGTVIGGWMFFFSLNGRDGVLIALCAAITALIAAVLMEMGTEHAGISAGALFALVFSLIGVTPALAFRRKRSLGKSTGSKKSLDDTLKEQKVNTDRIGKQKVQRDEGVNRIRNEKKHK